VLDAVDHGRVRLTTSGTRTTPALWVLTRALVLVVLFGPESRVVGDVVYFTHSLRDLSSVGPVDTMPEYPLAALGVVMVPWLAAGALGAVAGYGFVFVACALLGDAGFTVLLSRAAGGDRRVAVVAWLVSVPAMGGLAFVRFDIVPGVLVGVVLLLSATRPRTAALCLALATSVKLWPALLLPPVLARTRHRRSAVAVVAGVGAVAVLGTLALGGWARVLSPLRYQGERGLQVESLAATPLMVLRAVDPASYQVVYAHKAYEVLGPDVPALLVATTVLTVTAVLGLTVVWWRLLRGGRYVDGDAVVWVSLAAVLALVCTSRVLSPQYLMWVLPAAAAGLVVVSTAGAPRLLRWTCGLVVATALSHAVYPWLYPALAGEEGTTGLAVSVLAVRNLLLLALLVVAGREAWCAAGRRTAPPAARPVTEPGGIRSGDGEAPHHRSGAGLRRD